MLTRRPIAGVNPLVDAVVARGRPNQMGPPATSGLTPSSCAHFCRTVLLASTQLTFAGVVKLERRGATGIGAHREADGASSGYELHGEIHTQFRGDIGVVHDPANAQLRVWLWPEPKYRVASIPAARAEREQQEALRGRRSGGFRGLRLSRRQSKRPKRLSSLGSSPLACSAPLRLFAAKCLVGEFDSSNQWAAKRRIPGRACFRPSAWRQ